MGLERVKDVAERLQLIPSFPIISIAGTNGKGSTCAMLESIYLDAGYRVGTYVSPHLKHYNERVRVNHQAISDAALCEAFSAIEAVRADVVLTYFEMGTLAAMWHFAQSNLDVAILEVGMGGRLDAVNVFEPTCSIVTCVDLDHMDYLGDTREKIGAEKAGIYRPRKLAICGDINPPNTVVDYAEQIQAASATPSDKATVQGQLEELTSNFDAANPPAWAAGTLRAVQAQMAARGLGASSMAGQAMIQGALESALPIAQADASIQASFEQANLSNRQQRAMLAAEQRATFLGLEFTQEFQARVQNSARISDVANQNFTAEQSIALENSRTANTINLQNLSNTQALTMSEAAALSQMDSANLNNRQQAAVQNSQSFLQMDMANVSNQQQTELFKAQQRVQGLFTDQAAENASRQFNASSKNQTDQFFSNLITQASQFNATQANAQSQYNSGQRNVLERFNAELNNQRDTFNAQNRLVIDQNNATWRRQVATADTATVNRVNEINATNLLATSTQAYNNLWNYYGDTMEWAWTSAENQLNRYADMSIANLNADTQSEVAKRGESTAAGSAIGSLIGTLGTAFIMSCWVAREVYGEGDPRWYVFRMWLKYKAPTWFRNLYEQHGEDYAKFIKKKPIFKWMTRKLMDLVVKEKSKKGMISYV